MVADQKAFPLKKNVGMNEGLTSRDYIAIKAMQGLVSDSTFGHSSQNYNVLVAQQAYQLADAMIKQSNK